MQRTGTEPRASPTVFPAKLKQLIRDAYEEDYEKRLSILTMIERHLCLLNELGEQGAAEEFLVEQDAAIREDAKILLQQKKRARFRLVVRNASPLAVVIVGKYYDDLHWAVRYIASHLGL